jgi:hypothetical protein
MATGLAAASPLAPVEALNQLNDIATRYCESQMFFAGCSLGIFDELAKGPASCEELAGRLGFHAEAGRRLLTGLCQLGLLQPDGGRFRNSAVAEYLTASSSVLLSPLLVWGKLFYPIWGHLDDAVRECSPRWQQTFGATQQETFANLYKDADALARFCGIMSAYSIPQGQLLAQMFDFSRIGCVLDVAGGPGGLIIEIGKRYSHLRGIVMDLPPVCELADRAIAAAGLNDRFVSRVADLFEGPYPEGADAISLAWVLHDWNDEHCRQILRNCHAALPRGGTLVITESVLNADGSGTSFARLMSLHMLVLCEPGARERTETEYADLLADSGFGIERLLRAGAPRDFLIARKL